MSAEADVRWEGATSFAEVAEALGTATDHIMARQDQSGAVLVLYTPVFLADPADPVTPVWRALLRRDRDGILRLHGQRQIGTLADFIAAREQ